MALDNNKFYTDVNLLDHKIINALLEAATIASSDKLLISDASDGGRIKTSSIAFGTDTTKFLSNAATWVTIDLSTKLDKVTEATTYDQVYIKLANGSQGMISCSDDIVSGAIVKRKYNQIKGVAPVSDNDLSVKSYVDSGDATASTKVKQTLTSNNYEAPVMFKANAEATEATNQLYFNTSIRINPSTGTLSATLFKENGSLLSDKYVTITDFEEQIEIINDLIDNKLDKVVTTSTYDQLYAKLPDGSQGMYSMGTAVASALIVKRDGMGRILVSESPDLDNQAISKSYADLAATKVSQINSTTNSAFPILLKNTTGTGTISQSTQFTTKVQVNPSTGVLTATTFSGSGASLTNLNASNLSSGTVNINRIPTGTTATTVALGNHTHSDYLSINGGDLNGNLGFNNDEQGILWQVQHDEIISDANGLHINKSEGTTTYITLHDQYITITSPEIDLDGDVYINGDQPIVGGGTSGYLAKFNGSNSIVSGPQLGTSTTTFLRNDGTWATPVDTKVTSVLTSSSTTTYPLLFKYTTGTSGETNSVRFCSAITVTPSGIINASKFVPSTKTCTVTGRSSGWTSRTVSGATAGYVSITPAAGWYNFHAEVSGSYTSGSWSVFCLYKGSAGAYARDSYTSHLLSITHTQTSATGDHTITLSGLVYFDGTTHTIDLQSSTSGFTRTSTIYYMYAKVQFLS